VLWDGCNGTYGLRERYPNARKPAKKGGVTRAGDRDDNDVDEADDGIPSPPSSEEVKPA
jgi:hypothetical protein